MIQSRPASNDQTIAVVFASHIHIYQNLISNYFSCSRSDLFIAKKALLFLRKIFLDFITSLIELVEENKSDLLNLLEGSLFAIAMVLIILQVGHFIQIFLSGIFAAPGRSARRQEEDLPLLSNFLSSLNNRYLEYFIKYL